VYVVGLGRIEFVFVEVYGCLVNPVCDGTNPIRLAILEIVDCLRGVRNLTVCILVSIDSWIEVLGHGFVHHECHALLHHFVG
jgi:hypothetical protein